jgi:hypothetical protein
MTNAAALRERAEELRIRAKDYAPDVGLPLSLKARALERLAAELERNGRERRQPALTLREQAAVRAPRLFGRRGLATPPASRP